MEHDSLLFRRGGGMDYRDYYWGLHRGYYRDPFPHSLLSTREMKWQHGVPMCCISICGLRVERFYWRLLGGNKRMDPIVELIQPKTHRSVSFIPFSFAGLATSN